MATVKKQKAVMPIVVEGETFASLQNVKNLDSDMSIEEKLRLLYKLQKTDSKIDNIQLLRGELPLEVQDLEDDILGLKTRIANLSKEIKEIEAFISQKKLDIVNSKTLIAKYEEQRNNVKNNREYDSLSKEIEYQELDCQLSEKRINDSTKLLAEKKSALEETNNALAGREEDLVNKKNELETIVNETQKDEEQLLLESSAIKEKIDARLLHAYEKVRNNARQTCCCNGTERCLRRMLQQDSATAPAGYSSKQEDYCLRILRQNTCKQ